MIDLDFHLIEGWEMEQICRTAWIDEDPVDVKLLTHTVNTSAS